MVLKNKRKQLGYTLKDMSLKLNLQQSTLSQYETNKNCPHLKTLAKIIRAYELTPQEVMSWINELEKQ